MGECILCGMCAEILSSVFYVNDLGFVQVTELRKYPASEVDEVIKHCPADCIEWE